MTADDDHLLGGSVAAITRGIRIVIGTSDCDGAAVGRRFRRERIEELYLLDDLSV